VSDEKSLGHYNFETGGYVRILASANLDTREALDMVDMLVRMKRDELDAIEAAKVAEDAARDEAGKASIANIFAWNDSASQAGLIDALLAGPITELERERDDAHKDAYRLENANGDLLRDLAAARKLYYESMREWKAKVEAAERDLAATRALLAEAEEALTEQKEWHEAERKALGKQPQTGDLPWRRNQHLEQIDVIDAVLALIKSATSADGGEAR